MPKRGSESPRREGADHTLAPSALVKELFVRLMGSAPIAHQDRALFPIAAQTLHGILIDYARARVADKRGGDRQRLSLSAVEGWNPIAHSEDLLAFDQALSKLEIADAV